MISVCYTGPFGDASGYGEATRNFIRALHEAGANIKTEKVEFTTVTYEGKNKQIAEDLSDREVDYKVKIIHTTPDVYAQYMEKDTYNIGHLFWETDKLPSGWEVHCNKMDEIWTGTDLNKKAIVSSGVTVPVTVIPQAIETIPLEAQPFIVPGIEESDLVFYSIFDWNDRKDPRTLLRAFWKQFKGHDDVKLIIKTHVASHDREGQKKILADIAAWKAEFPWKDKPKVAICTKVLTDEEKHRFHETGNVFVSSHRGEGWGLPQVEALVHKNAVVSTSLGGVHEYLNTKQYYPIKFELIDIKKVYNKYYEPGMKWGQASEEHLQEQMSKIYEYHTTPSKKFVLAAKAGSGRNLITSIFNYKSIGIKMINRIEEIEDGK